MEGFQVVMQMVLFPMLFLSGALFPLSSLPSWLSVLTHLNPLTYAVAPLRHVVFAVQNMPAAAHKRFPDTVELFGHTLSVAADLAIVAAFAAIFVALAVRGISHGK
jgi:ABC-2 type transport system permease protein